MKTVYSNWKLRGLVTLLVAVACIWPTKSSAWGGGGGGGSPTPTPAGNASSITPTPAPSQAPQATQQAATSVEGTMLAYNAIQRCAIEITSRLANEHFGTALKPENSLIVVTQTDLGTIFGTDVLSVQLNSFDAQFNSFLVILQRDSQALNPPKPTPTPTPAGGIHTDKLSEKLNLGDLSQLGTSDNVSQPAVTASGPSGGEVATGGGSSSSGSSGGTTTSSGNTGTTTGNSTSLSSTSTTSNTAADITAMATAVQAAIPTTTDSYSNVSADSISLELAIVQRLVSEGADGKKMGLKGVYTPGLFQPPRKPSESKVLTLLNAVNSESWSVNKAMVDLQQKLPPPTPTPAAGTTPASVSPAVTTATNDLALATTVLTSYQNYYSTIGVPDSSGLSPVQRALESEFIQGRLADNGNLLVVRCENTVAAVRNDRGFFWGLGLIPWPHSVYKYGGECSADYALFNGNGAILNSGLVRTGTAEMSGAKFKERFKRSLTDRDVDVMTAEIPEPPPEPEPRSKF